VTFELARLVGPAGQVLALDIDETKLELARQEAAALRLGNVEFRRSAIGDGDPETGFDLVYARFLLTHLPYPSHALSTMLHSLRPGGALVVEDIDMSGSFCHPESAAYRRYVELYTQAAQRNGADPNLGPKLPGLLAAAGLADVQMHVVQPAGTEGEVKLVGPITMEYIADAVLAAGLASRAEVEQIVKELYVIAEDRKRVVSLPRIVQAWGRLPA
jgi:SAM-dependent methyltransferase